MAQKGRGGWGERPDEDVNIVKKERVEVVAEQAGIKQEIRVSHFSWHVCKDRASAF